MRESLLGDPEWQEIPRLRKLSGLAVTRRGVPEQSKASAEREHEGLGKRTGRSVKLSATLG
jgi:hypothetical protein